MKIILILFQLVLTSYILLCQEHSVKIGIEIKEEASYRFGEFAHFDNEGIYTYCLRRATLRNTLFLEKYDYNFNLIFAKQQPTESENLNTHGVRFNGQNFIWLTSKYERKENKLNLYLTEIDLKGQSGPTKKFISIDVEKNRPLPKIEWKFSHDLSKIPYLFLFKTLIISRFTTTFSSVRLLAM